MPETLLKTLSMKITLKDKAVHDSGFNVCDILVMLAIHDGFNPLESFEKLQKHGYITTDLLGKYYISNKATEIITKTILESEDLYQTEDIEDLAKRMIELFPKGKKDTTPWRGNYKDIATRLLIFFKKYGRFPLDDIYDATKRYVDSFNGNYTYMRTLKYFIWKNEKNSDENGVICNSMGSDLMSWIEDKDSSDSKYNNYGDTFFQ